MISEVMSINMWLDQEASLELGHARKQRLLIMDFRGGELKANGARPQGRWPLLLVGWRAVLSPGTCDILPPQVFCVPRNWVSTLTLRLLWVCLLVA